MNYIRTKDNIYEECAREKYPNGCVITTSGVRVPYTDILCESDNPEDLCDEFVWVTPEGEHRIKPKTGDALWYLCCDYKQGHQIYGAIWTDKGLSYVMKMNDIGKWELL